VIKHFVGEAIMSENRVNVTAESLDRLARIHKGELQPPAAPSQSRRKNLGFAAALNATGPRRNRTLPAVRTGPVAI
jgi:hypothetical protein